MKFTTAHHESWAIDIEREEGDDWPVVPLRYHKNGKMHVKAIRVLLHRGSEHPTGSLSGVMIKQDGTPGKAIASEETCGGSITERWPWTAPIIDSIRETADLETTSTGCG